MMWLSPKQYAAVVAATADWSMDELVALTQVLGTESWDEVHSYINEVEPVAQG